MLNLKKFYEENNCDAIQLPITKIVLKESIHKKNTPTEVFAETDKPIVVHYIDKGIDSGKYRLIIGWREYHSALQHNKDIINVILVPDKNRYVFINRVEFPKGMVELKRLKVSNDFQKSPPKEYKIEKAINFYENNGRFDKPVKIDKNKIILDGYARYIAAQRMGIKCVPVKVVR